MTLASNPKNIGKVEAFLKKVKAAAKFDEILEHKVMIALTEAVNNGIVHGNKSNPAKKVLVFADVEYDGVLFTVLDQGKGFKPETVSSPLKHENLLKENGRGIFLMRTLADRVEFKRTKDGMDVRLWFQFKS